MSKTEGSNMSAKQIVEEVLGKYEVEQLWGAGYKQVLPCTPQDFSMGGILPAVLYMMRWGHRRGMGKFISTYGNPSAEKTKDKTSTINNVTDKLSQNKEHFEGFKSTVHKAIFSDLLLAFCLENKNHSQGRDEPVQRVFPTHYFSSWIDLPQEVANLRGIPELIVSIMTRQKEGNVLEKGEHGGYFSIASGFKENLLLNLFGPGTLIKGKGYSFTSEEFEENTSVGIDQLLTIRLAQSLKEAPMKARGKKPLISNQQPAASLARDYFYEDFNIFLRAYGKVMPRLSLLPILESCIAIGLTNIFFTTLNIMLYWEKNGKLPKKEDQSPLPVFIDCSLSNDFKLRRLSEESMDNIMRKIYRFPIIMMALRILEQRVIEEDLNYPPSTPEPEEWINFLGDVLYESIKEAYDIKHDLKRNCKKLANALKKIEDNIAIEILENPNLDPLWRMSEALVLLMTDKLQSNLYRKFIDSCLMVNEPNGIARKRSIISGGKKVDRRSIVLTNTVLDFLVHRHLINAKKGTPVKILSLEEFINILRERYGFYIDEAPPGLSVPVTLLRKNRIHLERRLRDLGLFIGVNDAESMKRLRQRYKSDGKMRNNCYE